MIFYYYSVSYFNYLYIKKIMEVLLCQISQWIK